MPRGSRVNAPTQTPPLLAPGLEVRAPLPGAERAARHRRFVGHKGPEQDPRSFVWELAPSCTPRKGTFHPRSTLNFRESVSCPIPKAGRGGAEEGRPGRLVLLCKLVIGSGSCGSGHCGMFPTRWVVRPRGSLLLLPPLSSHHPLAARAPPSAFPRLPEWPFLSSPPLQGRWHPETL